MILEYYTFILYHRTDGHKKNALVKVTNASYITKL